LIKGKKKPAKLLPTLAPSVVTRVHVRFTTDLN
jgi:hypothetical protein